MSALGATMTDVTLRDYVDTRIEGLWHRIDARLDGMVLATKVNADTLTERMEHSNGLIEQMRQQSAEFARHGDTKALAQRIEVLEQQRSKYEGREVGRQPLSAIWMMMIAAVVSAVVAFAAAQFGAKP